MVSGACRRWCPFPHLFLFVVKGQWDREERGLMIQTTITKMSGAGIDKGWHVVLYVMHHIPTYLLIDTCLPKHKQKQKQKESLSDTHKIPVPHPQPYTNHYPLKQ